MYASSLLIADPPHRVIDAPKAAPVLGLVPAEMRMYANYPAPEIWLADADRAHLEALAETLEQAGLSVAVVEVDRVRAVAPRIPVDSFTFSDTGFACQTKQGDFELGYDDAVTIVFCQPGEEQDARQSHDPLTEGLKQRRSGVFMTRDSLVGMSGLRGSRSSTESDGGREPAFLDLYFSRDGEQTRASVVEGAVDFKGLGELMLPRSLDNMVMLAAELEDKFSHCEMDRRLMNVRPPTRARVGRVSLSSILESVSSGPKVSERLELASRLVYLTKNSVA